MKFMQLSTFVLLGAFLGILGCAGGKGPSVAPPAQASSIVSATFPADGQSNVPLSSIITARFDRALLPDTVTTSTFMLFAGSEQIAGRVEVDGSEARFLPASALRSNRQYQAIVTRTVQAFQGVSLSEDYSWRFTTVDVIPPQIVQTMPLPGLRFADTSVLSATFSEEIDISSIRSDNFIVAGPSGNIPGHVAYRSPTFYFYPDIVLDSGVVYQATLRAAISDLAGNPLGQDYVWSFLTNDSIPPVVVSTLPVDGASAVETLSTITATFSENIDPLSLSLADFAVIDDLGNTIPGSIVVSGSEVQLQLSVPPYLALAPNTHYTVTLNTGIEDQFGNPLSAPYSWSFDTQPGWGMPVQIDGAPEDAEKVSACFDSARQLFHLIWKQKAPGSTVFTEVSTNSVNLYGGIPAQTVPIEYDSGEAEAPVISADASGNVQALWQQKFAGETVYSVIANGLPSAQGASWDGTLAAPIESSALALTDIQIVTGVNQQSYAIWRSNADVFVSHFSLETQSWEPEQTIDNEANAPGFNQIAVGSDGAVYAMWVQGASADKNVMFNFLAPGETSWSPSRAVVLDNSIYAVGIRPTPVPLADGTVLAVWPQRFTSGALAPYSILARTLTPNYSDGSVAMGSIDFIDYDGAASGLDAGNCRVAAAPDQTVFVGFEQKISGSYSILIRTRNPDGTWIPITGLSDPEVFIDFDGSGSDQEARNLQIAVDAGGRLCAVWQQIALPGSVNQNILARIRDGGWEPIEFIDNDGEIGTQRAEMPALSVDAAGRRFLAAWQQQIIGGSGIDSIFVNQFR